MPGEDSMTPVDRQTSEKMIAALDPYHTFVGRIASQWAFLDHNIDQAIWRLAEVEPALGACITTQLVSTPARLRVLLALLLLREGSDDLVKKLRQFAAKLHAASDKRNRAVHDFWNVTVEGDVTQLRAAIIRDKLELQSAPSSTKEMLETLKLVSGEVRKFVSFYHELSSWLDTSPQKWREPLPGISIGQTVGVSE
jgi:hypothetical protein